MSNNLTTAQWNSLVFNINNGVCTPFLGAGASYPHIPLGSKIAKDWSDGNDYPLEDREYLPRVAQFLAIESGSKYPKKLMQELCSNKADKFCDIHDLLAQLPLPVYITTNYDNFMFNALENHKKKPKRELCRWNSDLKENIRSVLDEPEYEPNPEEPLVFHLHGYYEKPESMVLTEDDYIDFLVNLSKDPELIPGRIKQALGEASLLFLGYSISDLNFRVLFRNFYTEYLKTGFAESHISVQYMKPPNKNEGGQKNMVQQYLEKYFGQSKVNMYWGTCDKFITDFKQHFH